MTNDYKPMLIAETRKARNALQRDRIPVDNFPFRVGREARIGVREGRVRLLERRSGAVLPNNDLYLLEPGNFGSISREHFQIEQTAAGGYELVDRGSTCGTAVGDRQIGGGGSGGRCSLRDGDRIVVGSAHSPYVFKFVVVPAALASAPGNPVERKHELMLVAASLFVTVLTFAVYCF